MSRNKALLQSLRRAVERETPDTLPEALLHLQQQKGADLPMTNATTTSRAIPYPAQARSTKSRRPIARWAGGIAAALLLAVGGIWGYSYYYTPQSIFGFDVNPSIELRVNRNERVLAATPLSDDAYTVLDGMNLKNTDLDVAVNALIGSMVKNGFISELKNSILISVDSADRQRGAELQQRLSSEVGSLLDAYSVSGAVLSQTLQEDARIRGLAQEHGISQGKAALVDRLVSQDDTLTFAGVAALPINDINLLLAARKADLEDVAASGRASSGSYIGEEKAKTIALSHAGILVSAARFTKTELDYDDGAMEYEIVFYSDGVEYEYKIDAATGAVLGYDRDTERGIPVADSAVASDPAVTEEKAKSIALEDARVNESAARFTKIQLDRDDGRMEYEIVFYSDGVEYEYKIDAVTGAVLESDRETAHRAHAPAVDAARSLQGEPNRRNAADSSGYIDADEAKSIALEHAGADASAPDKFEIELDNDGGRVVYEIEFVLAKRKYEYKIDAQTGEIIRWESERD